MSTHLVTRSRWLDWNPKARILIETAESAPTEPSKPSFVGFEGATSAESPKIEAELDAAEAGRGSPILNRAAVMALDGVRNIGDLLLTETGWNSQCRSWADWKAAALNRLFQEQGTSGQPGRITAATVRHGERKR